MPAHLKAHGFESRKEAYHYEANLKKALQMPLQPLVILELEVIIDQTRSLKVGIQRLEARIN